MYKFIAYKNKCFAHYYIFEIVFVALLVFSFFMLAMINEKPNRMLVHK